MMSMIVSSRHLQLLRADSEWPRDGRTAEKRDEIPPLHPYPYLLISLARELRSVTSR
jgi:hypothetical protein